MKIKEFLKEMMEKKKETKEDILLLHIDSFHNLLYSFFNLGLLYIATLLKSKGFKVRCVTSGNNFFLNNNKLKTMFINFSPRIAGFYINSDNIHNVIHMANELKETIPGVRIVAGGPLATVMKNKLLDYQSFDIIVSGEGEYPMLGLAEYYLKGNGSLKEIHGIIYRQDGKIICNDRLPPIKNLDELPSLDYDLIGVSQGFGFFYSTGRGCPHKCAFCFQEVHGQGYRFHSAKRVVSDIVDNVVKYNAKTLNIVDDTFIAEPSRVDEICSGLSRERKAKNLDFIFFCEGRVDTFDRHPDLIEKLRNAGMARLQIGVESGNQEILDMYRKRIRIEQVERVVERIGAFGGISVYGNFIIGGPFESHSTFEKTLALAKKLINLAPGQFECSNSFLCPFPGTEIGENPEKFGIKIADREWMKGLTMSDPSCYTENLSIEEIREIQNLFSREINDEMKKTAIKMSFEMMEKHFQWAMNYRMHTLYYMNILSLAPILESYFTIKKSSKFRRQKDIPDKEIPDWFPFRIIEKRTYGKGGAFIELPGYFRRIKLTRPDEIAVYEYSSGKMTIQQLAERIQKEFKKNMTIHEILANFVLPLFKRLEKSYHIIFYR